MIITKFVDSIARFGGWYLRVKKSVVKSVEIRIKRACLAKYNEKLGPLISILSLDCYVLKQGTLI